MMANTTDARFIFLGIRIMKASPRTTKEFFSRSRLDVAEFDDSRF